MASKNRIQVQVVPPGQTPAIHQSAIHQTDGKRQELSVAEKARQDRLRKFTNSDWCLKPDESDSDTETEVVEQEVEDQEEEETKEGLDVHAGKGKSTHGKDEFTRDKEGVPDHDGEEEFADEIEGKAAHEIQRESVHDKEGESAPYKDEAIKKLQKSVEKDPSLKSPVENKPPQSSVLFGSPQHRTEVPSKIIPTLAERSPVATKSFQSMVDTTPPQNTLEDDISVAIPDVKKFTTQDLIQQLSLEMKSVMETGKISIKILKIQNTLLLVNEYMQRLLANRRDIQEKLLQLKETDKQTTCKKKFDDLDIKKTEIKKRFDDMQANLSSYTPNQSRQIDTLFNEFHLTTYEWLIAKTELENVNKELIELPQKLNLYKQELANIKKTETLYQKMLQTTENVYKVTLFKDSCSDLLDDINEDLLSIAEIEARLAVFLEDKYFVSWLMEITENGTVIDVCPNISEETKQSIEQYCVLSIRDFKEHQLVINGILHNLTQWQTQYNELLNEKRGLPTVSLFKTQTIKSDITTMLNDIDRNLTVISNIMPELSKAIIKLKNIEKVIAPLNKILLDVDKSHTVEEGEEDSDDDATNTAEGQSMSGFLRSLDSKIIEDMGLLRDHYYKVMGEHRESELRQKFRLIKFASSMIEIPSHGPIGPKAEEEVEYLTFTTFRKQLNKENPEPIAKSITPDHSLRTFR